MSHVLAPIVPVTIREYFHTWETHDESKLRLLFAPDAEYDIIGKRCLKGIDAICRYWRRNAAVQRDVSWSVSKITETGGVFVFNWAASFFRCDLNQRLNLVGIMCVETRDDRIQRLAECYRRR